MFPAGTAGIALLIMRLASGSALLELLWRHSLSPLASSLLFILPGIAMFFGFLTPYASAAICLIELTSTVGPEAQLQFFIVISIANTLALGILGPGAYSLDSRIFGRRIIRISSRDKPQHSR
jgi:hypothetical protein